MRASKHTQMGSPAKKPKGLTAEEVTDVLCGIIEERLQEMSPEERKQAHERAMATLKNRAGARKSPA